MSEQSEQGRILLVEDEPTVRDLHDAILVSAGFATRVADNLAEMRRELRRSRYDIVLLDLRLPDGNALDAIPEIRANTSAGIIVATSSRDQGERLSGLERGADQFLEKPIHPRELLARVRNVIGRLRTPDGSQEALVYRFEGWTADLLARKVTFADGGDVHLTDREFRLLEALIRNGDRPVHRERLIALLSGDDEATDRAVDKVVYRTRLKLHEHLGNNAPLIETVHGYGYRLIARSL
ncbi:response regulator transcription factor [Marinibaculum pumilum]|uniref:Response regulator transcription factor n=1 Tax=Marinibaculum pumilum TaxID=1766165 RepID=A0ABV7L0L4_9PROT